MRYLLPGFIALVSVLSIAPSALADLGGTANGSACTLNGGTGYVYNGTCISASDYQSQSGVTGSQAGGGTQLLNPLKGGTNLESFLHSILTFVIRIGAIVVVFMLVYVGYLFVVARGAPAEIAAARKALLWTIVGALILLGAQAIALGLQATVDALSAGQ